MTSSINPNTIDGTYPIAGQDNNSQGFRDNFTQTKVNFTYAAQEISDLQTKAVLKAALTGTTLDNNMADNLIYAAKIQDFSVTKVAVTPSAGVLTLNYASGHYQTYSTATAGSVTLAFTNFPASGSYGYMKLQFTVTDYTTYTLTIPSSVSDGIAGIQGITPGTPGVTNTISFGANGAYEFGFGTYDGGSTITIFDLNRALTNFSGANIATVNIDASGYVSAVGNVRGGNINSTGLASITGNITGGNVNTAIVSASGNVQGGNIRTAGLVSATGNVTGGNVIGFSRPTTGTATIPTILLTSGSLMTGNSVTAGAFEYDGTVMYGAPSASNRGVLNTSHVITLASNNTLSDSSTAQAVFNVGTGGAGAIALPASTTYLMEAVYYITRSVGTNAHTLSTLFALGGSLTSIAYVAETTSTTGNVLGTVSRIYGTAATALAVTASSVSATENITVTIRGIVRTNAAGSFTPQIKYDSAPGGAPTVLANSYFKLVPIGNNSMTAVGNW